MTIIHISEIIHEWMGWCPNTPAMHIVPAVLTVPPETIHSDRPDGSGSAGSSGRIRDGISIATDSFKTIVRNRYLLGFSLLFGLAIFLLIVGNLWDRQYYDQTLPFVTPILFGDSSINFNPWLFLVELIYLSCFNLLLSALVLQRNENGVNAPVTIREGFFRVNTHAAPLAVLSIAMAFIATLGFDLIVGTWYFIHNIVAEIMNAFFWIPYAYFPYGDVSVLFSSFTLLFINIILLLAALCLIPIIVLKKKGMTPALAGSIPFIQRTWRQMLGCILVYGTIVLIVAVASHMTGQLLPMFQPGYEAPHLGHPLMMAVYFGFILTCSVLLAAGFTAAGVAISYLSCTGKRAGISGVPEENLKKPEPAS
ncbi:MAG: hypothetical protein WC379_18555 [Methanoregula sp.]|jgi:hypothetical protein